MSPQDESHQDNIPDLGFYVVLLSGEPFDTTKPVNRAVSNIICSLVYGYRFEYGDSEFTSLVDRTNKFLEVGGSPSIQVTRDFSKPLTLPMFHHCWCAPVHSCLSALPDFQLVPVGPCTHRKQEGVRQVVFRQQDAQPSPVRPFERDVEPAATQRLCGRLHGPRAKCGGGCGPGGP